VIRHSPETKVTVYGLGDGSSIPGIVSRPTICIFQSAIRWILKADYPGVKRLGREAFYLFKSIAEVDSEWNFTYS